MGVSALSNSTFWGSLTLSMQLSPIISYIVQYDNHTGPFRLKFAILVVFQVLATHMWLAATGLDNTIYNMSITTKIPLGGAQRWILDSNNDWVL